MFFIIFLTLYRTIACHDLTLLSQTRSTYLDKYTSYIDAVVLHFDVPEATSFASFEFRGSLDARSIFICSPEKIAIYLQEGAPPVINPDNSKFPKDFLLHRTDIHELVILSNKTQCYINLRDPNPGSYYALAFHPYVKPKDESITQEGILPMCQSYIDVNLYVKNNDAFEVFPSKEVDASMQQNITYKIYIPEGTMKMLITTSKVSLCEDCDHLQLSVFPSVTPQYKQNATMNKTTTTTFDLLDTRHYFIRYEASAVTHRTNTSFSFKIKLIENAAFEENDQFLNASGKLLSQHANSIKANFYNLHKSLHTDSFQFAYDLEVLIDGSVPVFVNLTDEGISVLKFNIRDVLDVGGTLNVALTFVPKFDKVGRFLTLAEKNHSVVGCLQRHNIGIPLWENECRYGERTELSRLLINSSRTTDNFLVPYPEAGDWYLTLKLFCGEQKLCSCPKICTDAIKDCTVNCELTCSEAADCVECHKNCLQDAIEKTECVGCDCDGNARRSKESCNTSILFDISSYPCVGQKCGPNGKCAFGVSEGFVYSTCVCRNNYKGWDCSDDSDTNSLLEVWTELLLLVFSNLAFILTIYIAYKRNYYNEAIVYFSAMFSSTFYHACDAGENIISFCLMPLHVLQFCDFYSAVLSIWVTLIAIANLQEPAPHLWHLIGAICLGAAMTYDKQSLWVFAVPVTIGVLIVILSWVHKYFKCRSVFPNGRYLIVMLPSGLLTALVALLMFSLLETKGNYKFIHSLWHIMMAISVCILLPREDTFLPNTSNYL